MFGSIEVPFESVMLFNVVKLKAGVEVDDVELAVGAVSYTHLTLPTKRIV